MPQRAHRWPPCDDPDRIREPMIKVDGQWQEVSWDAAFRRCTELLAPVIDEYGIGAVTAYTGNPLAHSFSLARYAGVLMGMSGMPITYCRARSTNGRRTCPRT